jgi:radical SAM protein with 4Fe4S-binding SPASM domain
MALTHSRCGSVHSYTAPGAHTTAAAIGKQYADQFPPSSNPVKRAERNDDGALSSGAYARSGLATATPRGAGAGPADRVTPRTLRLDYHHPLERWLGNRLGRWLLRKLSAAGPDGRTALERIVATYRDGCSPWTVRAKYWPAHRFIDRMRGDVDVATFRRRLAEHAPTLRGLVIVARSLAEYGLTVPQRFVAPLFAVWNFTNRCNLSCRHCYQDSRTAGLSDELNLAEKLDLVDQMGQASMPMLAISGGEPTVSPHLLPVLRRAQQYGMHTTIATNGTTMTPPRAAELAQAGLRYVEISLDSVDPARHDAFRGQEGMWRRAVAGAKAVVATPGLRLGIAMCVHQGNVDEVADMIAFAEDLGAGCFAHFNFIPVGRGLRMVRGDITPAQRERLLALLNAKMQAGGMGVISTAPQLGRVCLAGAAGETGRVSCSHAGSGSGVKARVVAKYLGGCGAGRTYVCIEPAGDVTPCVYLPHRVMGNVRSAGLIDIFCHNAFADVLNDRSHRLHHCEVCAFRNYCGGCRARADAYFGQLHAGDPGCIFNDRHWQGLVKSGVAASEESPSLLSASSSTTVAP